MIIIGDKMTDGNEIFPFEILAEIAKWHGITFVKLMACNRRLQSELPKQISFTAFCRARVEWDGILIRCGNRYPLVARDWNDSRKYHALNGAVHQDVELRMFKCYHEYSVLMLLVSIKAIVFRLQIYSIVRVMRRDSNGQMCVIMSEMGDVVPPDSEYQMSTDLFDQYAIEMYGDKIIWDTFRPPGCKSTDRD